MASVPNTPTLRTDSGAGSPGRILLIRPSALGDVCRSVPVLASLRRAFPNARIDWLVQDSFADAIRHHPDLNSVIEFPRRRFGAWHSPGVVREIWTWLGGLRQNRYDWAVDAQGLARSGLFTRWCGAPVRIGPAKAPELAWLAYNRAIPVDRSMPSVDRMLALLRGVGLAVVADTRLYAPPEDRRAVDADPQFAGRRYAVLAPTSRWPGKRWPEDRFAKLARRMLGDGIVEAVVLVGARSEREQCDLLLTAAQGEPRIIDRIGQTTVGRLMALIESSALVVANDSAAVHMAVGFDRPLIGLYGPTNATREGPYRRIESVVQRVEPDEKASHKDEALGRRLMERITLDEVLDRVGSIMAGRREG